MFDTWKIVTNHNERRILVVNGILSEEYKKELRWEDYEAIFIESFSDRLHRITRLFFRFILCWREVQD